jgi:RNA polymerase sigma-70 factor (ECF subfamily)
MENPDPLEGELRAHCDAGRWPEAATALLRGYGSELFGFLFVAHRENEGEAADAFSDLTYAIWRGLPSFQWNSSARTWAYAIARKLVLTRRRDAGRQRRRLADVGGSGLERIAERVRTETASFLRTATRTRIEALRDSLAEEDRLLLLLRVDRKLAWSEIARVLAEEPELDEAALTRGAARLRKRFQLVKDRLRELARREGLLE